MWIGLRNTGGVWRWVGRVTSALPVDDDSWENAPAAVNIPRFPYGCVYTKWSGIRSCNRVYTGGYPICEKREG